MKNIIKIAGAPGSGKSTTLQILSHAFRRTLTVSGRSADAVWVELARAPRTDAVMISTVGEPGAMTMADVEEIAREHPHVRFYVAVTEEVAQS